MAFVATSLHTTLVTKVVENTLEALATTTAMTYTNLKDITTFSSQAQSTLTETIIHTVLTTLTPFSTSPSSMQTPSSSSSSKNGIISANPHRFPTVLVAILLSLLSLALLTILLICLRRLGYLRLPIITIPIPALTTKTNPGDNYVWSAYGLVRQSSLERSKKRHRLRDLQREAELRGEEDPIAVAIRKEEQERWKKEMEERDAGSKFYAPQVRHLVQMMGSKEEVRIDVRGQLRRAKSWRWGRGKGMSEEEVRKSNANNAGGGV